MFGSYSLSLGRIYDRVVIKEGGQALRLTVNADPNRIVLGIGRAQERLVKIDKDTPPEELKATAEFFAGVIFGEDQAKKLMEYYHNDAMCVTAVCAQYFSERLNKLITRAQKRQKAK